MLIRVASDMWLFPQQYDKSRKSISAELIFTGIQAD